MTEGKIGKGIRVTILGVHTVNADALVNAIKAALNQEKFIGKSITYSIERFSYDYNGAP